MNFRHLFAGAAVAVGVLGAASAASAAGYVFVGSWAVADGPRWDDGDVIPLSGRQTAALLFGGAPTDYAVSTTGADPNNINFKSFLDGYGDTQFLTDAQDQDFVGLSGDTYDAGYGNYSAYVFDHACGIYYCDNGGGENAFNYAFRVDNRNGNAVPEPATWALMIMGFGGVGAMARSRRKALAAA